MLFLTHVGGTSVTGGSVVGSPDADVSSGAVAGLVLGARGRLGTRFCIFKMYINDSVHYSYPLIHYFAQQSERLPYTTTSE